MTARSNGSVPPSADGLRAHRPYTYKDLAELWQVKEQTVRRWVMQLRRCGQGPTHEQAALVQVHAGLRVLKIRADYAIFVQQQKVYRMK